MSESKLDVWSQLGNEIGEFFLQTFRDEARKQQGAGGMRTFHLQRETDETGVSGVGRVAEGVVFTDGTCAMRWLSEHTSTAIYTDIEKVRYIHGHKGLTKIVFDDEAAS